MTVVNDYSKPAYTDFVDSTVTAYAAPAIVPMRTTGTQPPVFCIHPIEGLTSCYTDLVEQLGDERPAYGIQAVAGRPTSLAALATRYADEILAVRAAQSVHLLGLSFGGLLAHAVAVELQHRGVTVENLVLIASDPLNHADDPQHELLERMGDVIDRSRAEELLAVAAHNESLARGHFPGVFVGQTLVVSADDSDTGPAWHPFVSGEVVKHLVPDVTDFALVGQLVDRFIR